MRVYCLTKAKVSPQLSKDFATFTLFFSERTALSYCGTGDFHLPERPLEGGVARSTAPSPRGDERGSRIHLHTRSKARKMKLRT